MFIGTAWAGLGIALCWMPATPRPLYPVCWTPASPSSPTASTQRGAVFVQGLPRLPPGEGAWASAPLGSPVRAPSLLGCGWPEVARRRLGRPSPLTAAKPASVPPPRAADGPWTRGLHATPRAPDWTRSSSSLLALCLRSRRRWRLRGLASHQPVRCTLLSVCPSPLSQRLLPDTLLSAAPVTGSLR